MIFNKAVVATMIMLAAAASVDKVAVSAALRRLFLKSGKNGAVLMGPLKKNSKNSKKNPPPLTPEESCEQNSDITGYRWCDRTQTCDPPGDDACVTPDPIVTDFPTTVPIPPPAPTDGPTEEPEPLLDLADTLWEQGYTAFVAALKAADLLEMLSSTKKPEPLLDITDTVEEYGYPTLEEQLTNVNLAGDLSFEEAIYYESFTIMAPTNAAFDDLGVDLLECLFAPQYVEALRAILLYHLAEGESLEEQLVNKPEKLMMNGENIIVAVGEQGKGNVIVGYEVDQDSGDILFTAAVEQPDMIASNGIAHGIDGILSPQGTVLYAYLWMMMVMYILYVSNSFLFPSSYSLSLSLCLSLFLSRS